MTFVLIIDRPQGREVTTWGFRSLAFRAAITSLSADFPDLEERAKGQKPEEWEKMLIQVIDNTPDISVSIYACKVNYPYFEPVL